LILECRIIGLATSSPNRDDLKTKGGAVAKALAKGTRITGAQRTTLASQYAKRYAAGDSIRKIADDAGRSFGFVHGVLKEAGVELRGRGGATRGVRKVAASSAAKKTTAAPAKKAAAKKAPAKAPAKKSAAKKTTAKKTTAKAAKAPAKKSAAKKATAKKTTAKAAKAPAKKSAAKKATAKKTTAKKAPAKKR
jgi:Helix-turn-helix domain